MATDPDTGKSVIVSCDNFNEFQAALQTLRTIDDRIIYKLNTSVPTTSFEGEVNATSQCKDLYDKLQTAYAQRENAIKRCIKEASNEVQELRKIRNENPDDLDIGKKLRDEQWKLRLMQNELGIEEVVKDRSLKVFNERCWRVYKPESR